MDLARKLQLRRGSRLAVIGLPPGLDLTLAVQERGAQPVRQVSIDDVWSALRFRPR